MSDERGEGESKRGFVQEFVSPETSSEIDKYRATEPRFQDSACMYVDLQECTIACFEPCATATGKACITKPTLHAFSGEELVAVKPVSRLMQSMRIVVEGSQVLQFVM